MARPRKAIWTRGLSVVGSLAHKSPIKSELTVQVRGAELTEVFAQEQLVIFRCLTLQRPGIVEGGDDSQTDYLRQQLTPELHAENSLITRPLFVATGLQVQKTID